MSTDLGPYLPNFNRILDARETKVRSSDKQQNLNLKQLTQKFCRSNDRNFVIKLRYRLGLIPYYEKFKNVC